MKVVIVGSLAYSLVNFRGVLIRQIAAAGLEVVACAPDDDPDVVTTLNEMGARFRTIPMHRTSLSPLSDARTLWALIRLLREERPDILLAYTQKPIIYAGIASRLVHCARFFPMVTGFGYAFSDGHRVLRKIVSMLYRIAIASATSVPVYNQDDLGELRSNNLMRPGQLVTLVPGSGVDVKHFVRKAVPPGPPSFLMIARLLHDKGLREYVKAARIVRSAYPDARFALLGPFDTNPAAISRQELQEWQDEGVIDYLGATRDVRPYLAGCSVFVLPSYREGLPRTILEAMSTGRAIITTDAPGCRETVVDGENGFVVPVRDAERLAGAMLRFCGAPALPVSMGAISRKIAEQRFAVSAINALLLSTMGIASLAPARPRRIKVKRVPLAMRQT